MIVYKSRKMYTALQYDDELMEQTQTNSHIRVLATLSGICL